MRKRCEHYRVRVLGAIPESEGGGDVRWCRDCGAVRMGGERARWVLPGVRGRERQLRLVGVDAVGCPDCIGAACGFCDGSGMVSGEVAAAIVANLGGRI